MNCTAPFPPNGGSVKVVPTITATRPMSSDASKSSQSLVESSVTSLIMVSPLQYRFLMPDLSFGFEVVER